MAETKKDKVEREYVIPLRNKWKRVPRYKRANKAVKAIKEFLAKHMKILDRDLNKIKIDNYLNEEIWFRGIKKPPSKIKIKAVKEKDVVKAELYELPEKLKFKKAREEKREKKAEEIKPKEEPDKAEKPEESPEKKKEDSKKEETKKETEEKKAEEKEKKAAVVEAGQKMGKAAAKKIKHESRSKTKQLKRQPRKALDK